MLASQAKRLSDSYWDKVNLHSIVYHDMTKLYDLIKSAADDGKIVLCSDHLSYHNIFTISLFIMCLKNVVRLWKNDE